MTEPATAEADWTADADAADEQWARTRDAVTLTNVAVTHLDVTALGLEHRLVPSLELLRDVRALRTQLATIEAVIEAKCAGLMEDDKLELPGLYAQRRGGASRKAWDNEAMTGRVMHAVAQRVALNLETGEVDEAVEQHAAEAIELYADTARPSWRTGALKKLGVRFDDLCTTEYGRRTVQVSDAPPEKDGDDE